MLLDSVESKSCFMWVDAVSDHGFHGPEVGMKFGTPKEKIKFTLCVYFSNNYSQLYKNKFKNNVQKPNHKWLNDIFISSNISDVLYNKFLNKI